jgi:hypothetical protein
MSSIYSSRNCHIELLMFEQLDDLNTSRIGVTLHLINTHIFALYNHQQPSHVQYGTGTSTGSVIAEKRKKLHQRNN